jgi:hypothetical protein
MRKILFQPTKNDDEQTSRKSYSQNETITAYATPVPNETDTTDNTLGADKEVCVTIPSEVDGDFNVDLYGTVKLLIHYGAKEASQHTIPFAT